MKKYIALCVALVVMLMEVSKVLASPLGQHLNSKIGTSFSGLGAMVLNLKSTPEPGSLFLLGAVLFSLAFVVFWKAAKSSKQVQ